ncbi:MAG: acetyltransferase, partial [Alphaproteobacteria bacterium]
VSYNPPLWFLTCLFVTELLFYGLAKKYYGEPRKLVLWLIVAGVIGYLYSVYVPFRIPWNADVALTAIVFYGAGNLFKKITEREKKSGTSFSLKLNSRVMERFSQAEKYFPGVFVLLSLLYLGYLLEFPTADKVNMNVLKYGDFFPFYLLAFSGVFALVYIFKKVGSSKILEYYGKNSLTVLALHFPIKDVLTKFTVIIFGIELECFYCKTAFALSLTMLNLILLVPVIFIINNYLPFILGKKGSSSKFEDFQARLRRSLD